MRTLVAGASVAVVATVLAVAGSARVDGSQSRAEPFPHEPHQGLFPLCTGCHSGIPEGNEADFYPEPESCDGCHDGVDVERVEWSPPPPSPTNLDFSHPEHAVEVEREGDDALACATCHSDADAPRMVIDSLEAGQDCLSCHGHPADDHYVDATCETCHVPLAGTSFPRGRIAALPVPEDHRAGDFVREVHGEMAEDETARCATCHTRERCLTCHVDADRSEIAALAAAPSTMELPLFAAHYPVPESHADPDFETAHGALAVSAAGTCATCHTREDCASCHLAPLPEPARELTSRAEVMAQGVGIQRELPSSHGAPFFVTSHGAVAAADDEGCTTCHTQSWCAECHDAPGPSQFHPENFVESHPAAAFGQENECANCHDVQAFCRACHVQQGFGGFGRLTQGYHDAQPLWLLRHGQPARQDLETCASCHTQSECVQCHGQRGRFRVSPHGPDFDARRAFESAPRTCFACHLRAPFPEGGA